MAVITISRELGSEGDRICDLMCEDLGYCRVDKAVLMQIAEESGIDVDGVLDIEAGFSRRSRLVSGEMTLMKVSSAPPSTAFRASTGIIRFRMYLGMYDMGDDSTGD